MSKAKSILFILVFAIAIAMLSVTVNAETPAYYFSIESNKYETFEEAMTAAKNGDTIKVEDDYTAKGALGTVNKDVTLDLNGKKVVAKGSLTGGEHQPALVVNGATLTIKSSVEGGCLIAKQAVAEKNTLNIFVKNAGTLVVESGTIQAIESSYPYAIYLALADSKAKANKAVINGGTVEGFYAVTVRTNDELTVNGGELIAHKNGCAIATNGSDGESYITVNGGTLSALNTEKVVDTDGGSLAIYNPAPAVVTLKGGIIKGQTGIEMRAGTLNIPKDSTVEIEGTATPTSFNENGSGSTTNGAGIAVSQHTTKLDLKVSILAGTIKGHTALYEKNQNKATNTKEDYEKVSIDVNGGTFQAINRGTQTFYSETSDDTEGNAADVKLLQIHKATVVGETESTAKYLAADSAMKITENGATVDLEKNDSGDAYATGILVGDVLSVDIRWGSLTYICTETWDTTNHEYTYEWTATNPGTSDKITVTNHSNIKVTASFTYTAAENKDVFEGSFYQGDEVNSSFKLGIAGLGIAGENAPSNSVTLKITNGKGVDSDKIGALQNTKIGTVTVTVVKQQN